MGQPAGSGPGYLCRTGKRALIKCWLVRSRLPFPASPSVPMVDVVLSGAPVRAEMAEALRGFFPARVPT